VALVSLDGKTPVRVSEMVGRKPLILVFGSYANDFVKRFGYRVPLVVDGMDNRANALYAGWPERFYVVDRQGVIVYKGKLGPFGYHPEEVESWLSRRFPQRAAARLP
jgi:hypothetical protein